MAAPAKKIQAEPVAAKKAKGEKWGVLLLILALLNLGALGGLAYYLQNMWMQVEQLSTTVAELSTPKDQRADDGIGKSLQPKQLGVLFALDGFLVNLNSKTGPKFLQAQIELELGNPDLQVELNQKRAAVRDAVIVLLSSRSYAQLRKADGMTTLREDIKYRINGLLSTGKVAQVFFTQFHFN